MTVLNYSVTADIAKCLLINENQTQRLRDQAGMKRVSLFVIGSMVSLLAGVSSSAFAVSKQDLRDCQRYNTASTRARCVQALKNPSLRKAKINCRSDLGCWVNLHRKDAQYHCKTAFARALQWSKDWGKVWGPGDKMTHADWKSQGAGTLFFYRDEDAVRISCIFNPSIPQRVNISYGVASPYQPGVKLSKLPSPDIRLDPYPAGAGD